MLSLKKQLVQVQALLRESGATYSLKILGKVAALVAQLLMARVLSPSQFGAYAWILSLAALIALPSKLGWDTAVVRLIPRYRLPTPRPELVGLLRLARTSTILLAALAGMGLGILILVAHPGPSAQLDSLGILAAGLLVPALSSLDVEASILQGFRKVVAAHIPVALLRPLLVLIAVSLITILHAHLDAGGAIWIATTSSALAALATIGLFHTLVTSPDLPSAALYRSKQWLRISIPLLALSGFQLTLNHADILLVGLLSSASNAGVYAVASRLSTLVDFGMYAIYASLAPRISESFHAQDRASLSSILWKGVILVGPLTFVPAVALLIGGTYLLALYGSSYVTGYMSLSILALGRATATLFGALIPLLTMTNQERSAGVLFGITAILNIVLNLLLIPGLGIAGAALATSSSLIAGNAIILSFTKHRMRIDPSILGYLAHLRRERST